MPIDWSQIQQAVTEGFNLPLSQDLSAFETGDIQGEFKAVEQGLDVVSIFVPEAAEVERALAILAFVVYAYQMGWVRSAQPEDPAMARVDHSSR